MTTLFGENDSYVEKYLEEFTDPQGGTWFTTGDAGFIDEDGYVHVMGRTDDVLNVAGHRLSTGSLEEAVSAHPSVAECAVIGAPDALKGHVPVGLLVLRVGAEEGGVVQEVIDLVRERVGPVASFRKAVIVTGLPKTRSGKILRNVMRSLAEGKEGEDLKIPGTIEDARAVEWAAEGLHAIGYPDPSTTK
mmetsp:Transcript_29404/g.39971  ORF Transcript_29404/g.39971 Transcript_29404/m.39971 type:complete len:190 (-) Transcript_29404:174-743(-)